MTTTKRIQRQMLQELKMIKKYARSAEREIYLEKNKAHQTNNSPYLTDRAFYQLSAVKESPEEGSWKKVSSYEENREKWVEHSDNTMSQDDFEEYLSKKINII